jgi:hypothetical protein
MIPDLLVQRYRRTCRTEGPAPDSCGFDGDLGRDGRKRIPVGYRAS